MQTNRPSQTAAWVAAMRGLDVLLPVDARLIEDPLGVEFGESIVGDVARAARRHPRIAKRALRLIPPLHRMVLWMQVRTRVLDEIVRKFRASGGTQLVLLGAGYDLRALRLEELRGARVYEVDHPATQGRKLGVLQRLSTDAGNVRRLAWDFEARPLSELPTALRELGLDEKSRCLTIWEGVSNYLTQDAIEATFKAVHTWSAPGSWLAFTYFDIHARHRSTVAIEERVTRLVGEPFKSGWYPHELPEWMRARGFSVVTDESDVELCERWLPAKLVDIASHGPRHIALVERAHA